MKAIVRSIVGRVGAFFIYALILLFGRRVDLRTFSWLRGPVGGPLIGDRTYEEVAHDEGLKLTRSSETGGLIPDFGSLRHAEFDPDLVDRRIRDFYENTAAYRLDSWASTYFPANIALWLLVTTISSRVDQLNFPLDGLDTARGMTSEIILLTDEEGSIRYTGWYRKLVSLDRAIYTGFYMTETVPAADRPCVKVVFPMPSGNATVILRPVNSGSDFALVSDGREFGAPGFYRLQRFGSAMYAWRVATLRETFRLYVDDEGTVRCDHEVRFFGFRVLTLHYRIQTAR